MKLEFKVLTIVNLLCAFHQSVPLAVNIKGDAARGGMRDFAERSLSGLHRDVDFTISKSVSLNPLAHIGKLDVARMTTIGILATISASTVPLYFNKVLMSLTAPQFNIWDLYRPLSAMIVCHTIEPLLTIAYSSLCTRILNKILNDLRCFDFQRYLLEIQI